MEDVSEQRLRAAAGDIVFARGEDYVRYVHGLEIGLTSARATIQGRRVYLVDLRWDGPDLDGACTCPHRAEGHFCKHLVALGLAVLDRGGEAGPIAEPPKSAVDVLLDTLDAPELRDLLRAAAAAHPDVATTLELRAASRGADVTAVAARLRREVRDALRTRGFVDYRRSFDVAARANSVLDELAGHLDAGAADAVGPALRTATERLRAITLQADDSAGILGDACQRAVDLYARACREGHPDRRQLAAWLLKFRLDSPGWPVVTLADFASALDDVTLRAYRRGVDKAAGTVPPGSYDRLEVDEMLLELADHDGDLDRAIHVLVGGEHPRYADVVQRLHAAGRDEDALTWIDVARHEGRVSDSPANRNGYWLDPGQVAEAYRRAGRDHDAVEVLREALRGSPSAAAFRRLVAAEPDQRPWALLTLREAAAAPYGSGAVLVEVALAEADAVAAWDYADEYGAGHAWRSLVTCTSTSHPERCGHLVVDRIPPLLRNTDRGTYAQIAELLVLARPLFDEAGAAARFAALVARLREDYRRRPSFMAALDRAGL